MFQDAQCLPILYSLQNCPYAIRARFTLFKAKQKVLIRAVKLNNKPNEMLIASPKGSVPVLVVNETLILEESLAIMQWALAKNDPHDLLEEKNKQAQSEMVALINHFESHFIPALEAYCCAKRYHEDNLDLCRDACEQQLGLLEQRLSTHHFLFSNNESLFDIAVFPFIRKFARVERQWYLNSPYPKLRNWLDSYLQSPTFTKVMAKHELWLDNNKAIVFGE
ncbi:glutathione S-transferase [Psychromonas sp. Urea-02u-13]|uniref:glutathione S-transferase n=1 Tax=Psychromonas sp. Urea-02u-13 TaxID=2058326 RepID=UPI000C32F9AC|nr:glutathione S-transferase [Psychromonas sp. Urea-02u-13]PKG37727.1 glutathione S-transferase [Psychromonas sp. Urea-02u-13]